MWPLWSPDDQWRKREEAPNLALQECGVSEKSNEAGRSPHPLEWGQPIEQKPMPCNLALQKPMPCNLALQKAFALQKPDTRPHEVPKNAKNLETQQGQLAFLIYPNTGCWQPFIRHSNWSVDNLLWGWSMTGIYPTHRLTNDKPFIWRIQWYQFFFSVGMRIYGPPFLSFFFFIQGPGHMNFQKKVIISFIWDNKKSSFENILVFNMIWNDSI